MKETKRKAYARELDKIKKKYNKLTAKLVVKEAKNKNNPLHDYFDWDDRIAGERWRIHRARVLINIIQYDLIVNNEKKKVSKYELIKTDDDKEYLEVKEILSNRKYREQIIQQAIRELEYWNKKYKIYAELKPVVEATEKVKKNLKEKKNDRK